MPKNAPQRPKAADTELSLVVDKEFITRQKAPLLKSFDIEIYDLSSTARFVEARAAKVIEEREEKIRGYNSSMVEIDEKREQIMNPLKAMEEEYRGMVKNKDLLQDLLSIAMDIEKPHLSNLSRALDEKMVKTKDEIDGRRQRIGWLGQDNDDEKTRIADERGLIDRINAFADAFKGKKPSEYRTINLDFLSLRKMSDREYALKTDNRYLSTRNCHVYLPVFSIYHYLDPVFEIKPSMDGLYHKKNDYSKYFLFPDYDSESIVVNPALPSFMTGALFKPSEPSEEIHKILNKGYGMLSGEDANPCSFQSTFNSTIPQDTRKRIHDAKKTFGEDIYIIAETNNWSIKQDAPVVRPACPIVIGVNRPLELAFFIDSFYETSLEKLVLGTHVGTAPQN
jgi:hypothetical protein